MYKRYFENKIRNKNKENLNNICVIIKKMCYVWIELV